MAFDPEAEGWRPLQPAGRDDYIGLIGPFWRRGGGADLAIGLLIETRHLNQSGIAHGGLLASLADHALGMVVWEAARVPAVTIQLNNQFLSPAWPGEFVVVRGEVVHQARRTIFVRMVARVGDRAVLAADGVWKLRGSGAAGA